MKIDYEVLWDMFKQKKIKATELSEKMGYEKTYLSSFKNKGMELTPPIAMFIAKELGCDTKDFELKGTTLMPVMEDSDFEIEVKEQLKEIRRKVDSTHQAVMYLFNMEMKRQGQLQEAEEKKAEEKKEDVPSESPKADNKTEIERAKNMVEKMQMMANGGGIKYDDTLSRLKVMGIKDEEVLKKVIAENHLGVVTKGYGNNKCRWIVKLEEN